VIVTFCATVPPTRATIVNMSMTRNVNMSRSRSMVQSRKFWQGTVLVFLLFHFLYHGVGEQITSAYESATQVGTQHQGSLELTAESFRRASVELEVGDKQYHSYSLSRVEQRGHWIGNTWIPSHGWRYHSAKEMRDFYRGKSILWIGDSSARRAATTMYGILNSTNATTMHVPVKIINDRSVIDVNKKKTTEHCNQWLNHSHHPLLCRPTPGEKGGSFVVLTSNCLTGLEIFLEAELSGQSNVTNEMDVVILSLGIWEGIRPRDCKDRNESPRTLLARQNETIALLAKLQSERRTIVWRTSGYSGNGVGTDLVHNMNEKAMDQIEDIASALRARNVMSNLTFVDWGGAVRPRSFAIERITGDIHPHYGLEARHVLIQMIMNQLIAQSAIIG